MLDKLNALTDRFKELEEAIAQPDIIQNYEKYNILLKELNSLQPIVDKYRTYQAVSHHLEETVSREKIEIINRLSKNVQFLQFLHITFNNFGTLNCNFIN